MIGIASPSSVRIVVLLSLVAEAATAAAVALFPGLVARMLFARSLEDAGVAVARLLGITLMAFVIACWPGSGTVRLPAVRAVLAYNFLAGAYLAYLGVVRSPAGILLWPAVVAHVVVALLLATRSGNEGVLS